MAEHLRLSVGDIVKLQQIDNDNLSPDFLPGDWLIRIVTNVEPGQYQTLGYWQGTAFGPAFPVSQTIIDQWGKKLMSGPEKEQAG